jgi:hypothetical protein
MAVLQGTVAFENLNEYEVFNGQSTGKYSLVLTLDDPEANDLAKQGVKLREYEGVKQRKFSTKYPVEVIDTEDEPFRGRLTRGSKVKVLWAAGKPHPVHGTPTYLNKVRVVELATNTEGSEDF